MRKKINNMVSAIIILVGANNAMALYGYQSLSCSTQTVSDPLTSKTVTRFSNSSNITLPSSNRNCWLSSDYVVFESNMQRPSGSSTGEKEKQLIALDIPNERFLWLAPLEQEDTFIYGGGHFDIPSDSHFACSKENGIIVYRDITGHRLYLKKFSNNTTIELHHLESGTFLGAPSISDDGSVVSIATIHSGPNTDYYAGNCHSILVFRVDTENMTLQSRAEVPYSFACRKANTTQPAEVLEEAVLNGSGKWLIFETSLTSLEGKNSSRLCCIRSDGSEFKRLVENVEKLSNFVADKDNIYFTAEGGFARANINSIGYQKWRKISNNKKIQTRAKVSNHPAAFPFARSKVGMERLTVTQTGDIVYNTAGIYNKNSLSSVVIYLLDVENADKTMVVSARQGVCPSRKTNFHLSTSEKELVFTDYDVSESSISIVDMP